MKEIGRTVCQRLDPHSDLNHSSYFFFWLLLYNESRYFICWVYLVPDFLCGVHDVSEERVDRCVGHQDIDPPALIQSLFQTHDETFIVANLVWDPCNWHWQIENSHHLNQFFSVFPLANITGGAGHLDALALQQSHGLVHVGLPPAAHHHVGSSLSQSLGGG